MTAFKKNSPLHPVSSDTRLLQSLRQVASTQRVVCFAGLPGTGKSLLMHQLAHLAADEGRILHLLQWDMARPAFEAHPAAADYPVVNGVTHVLIRRAVGLWARQALVKWHEQYPDASHLLIGEAPFIGHRFIELAQRQPDAAEPYLTDPQCCFVIPVPSQAIRQLIEDRRQQRYESPLHQREVEDAPPHVLRALWQELVRVAPEFGLTTRVAAVSPYDPKLYAQVYQSILRHRHCRVIPVEHELPTTAFTPYDFTIDKHDLIPSSGDVREALQVAQAQNPDLTALQATIDQWYRV